MALTEKLPNSSSMNMIIRKITNVFPIILSTVLRMVAVYSRIFTGWIRLETWSVGILNPIPFRFSMNVLLMVVRVDSYFERFPENDEIVPPITKANPEISIIIPRTTVISAIHPGIFFFSSQAIG